MTYAEKLKDPRWQRRRLEILERDGWACRDCGDTKKTLHVHHCAYVGRDPWKAPEDVLLSLCPSCHESRQDLENEAHTTLGRLMAKMGNAEDDAGLRDFVQQLDFATGYEYPSVFDHDRICDIHTRMILAESALEVLKDAEEEISA